MTAATTQVTAVPPLSSIPPNMTLRALLDARRAEARSLSVEEAIAVIVPLCLDLQARHARGERLFVHPSCIAPGPDGLARLSPPLATTPPSHPRDRHCLAPELQNGSEPGDSRASVFSVGAILYEALTAEHVGPAMRRPRELDPSIPEHLEVLLSKALVGNPSHRPDDLGALASAMYHVAPAKSIHPPEVDEANIDASAELEVDVKLSLLPPPVAQVPAAAPVPRAMGGDPFGNVMIAPGSAAAPTLVRAVNDPTSRLAALKEQLESDVRPRYVVNKDRMDHGPFTAVELLQQVASGAFRGDDVLRDELSGQAQPLADWEEFAPFAEQAKLKQEITQEKRDVAAKEKSEKTEGIAKSALGVMVIVALVAIGAAVIIKKVGSRSDDVNVVDDPSFAGVDVSGDIKGQKRATVGGHGGGRGGFAGGMSYEAALASNNQEITMGAKTGPDLTDQQLAAPMRNAAFLDGCGAASSMKVTVRVAIKMGRAVGVSVSTNPPNPAVAGCIDHAVRGLSWPANAKMDSFTTTY